jgi:hypothetical protein
VPFRRSTGVLFAGLLLLHGCDLVTGLFDTCPSAGSYRSSACGQIVVLIQPPPEPWPTRHAWAVGAEAARDHPAYSPVQRGRPGVMRLHVVSGASPTTDTVSFRVIAVLMDRREPLEPGPLPVFAIDSALHVVHLVPNGTRPRADTVRLVLRRP